MYQCFKRLDPRWTVCLLLILPWAPRVRAQQVDARTEAAAQATRPDQIKTLPGFQVELLYTVPQDQQGSWVNLTVDPQGRLITSDQYGALYRVTPPALGAPADSIKVERLPVEIGEAQGLLWAFDSLYVVVNKGQTYDSGLYRVRDSNGDDLPDQVERLRSLDGGGEHGPHAVLLNPDGKSLTVVCGNNTRLTELAASRVPRVWGEDHLLPRLPDGRGFMAGVLGPGGAIYRIDPAGKNWELVSTGYRNPYDAAFNRVGDLFTFDADMEWDLNTPWYRPTRVNLAASGSDYGWRNGSGKWPAYYPDTLPAIVDIGPGSPTGVCFGYGTKFPSKYQEALYISDWSYGKLYAVHLTPEGAAYTGEFEEFLSGSPLPLTDVIVRPQDGALYFTIGGRRTTSGLYRVTYTGKEPTTPTDPAALNAPAPSSRHRVVRLLLEQFHGKADPSAVDTAWPYLGHTDRFLRHAARVAIEHQDPATWRDRALAEKEPEIAIQALLALVRVSASDPFHRAPEAPAPDASLKRAILDALNVIAWDRLNDRQRTDLLRVYEILFNRMGPPENGQTQALINRLDAVYPSYIREQNAELAQLMVYLQAPTAAAKTVALLNQAPTQEEQIQYAMALRMLEKGWTPELRRQYFAWFRRAEQYKGGASFGGFLDQIKKDAVARLSDQDRKDLADLLQPVANVAATTTPARPLVKEWTLDELTPALSKGLATGRDFDRGRRLFGAAQCFACHRYGNEGGVVGPDLSAVAGRFSPRDLLESIIVPSKSISDQYGAVTIATADGRILSGRIVNLNNDQLQIMPNMLDPSALETINRGNVEEMKPSDVSMMPAGLLNTLNQDEVLDLMAYLLSRGDRNAPMFEKSEKAASAR